MHQLATAKSFFREENYVQDTPPTDQSDVVENHMNIFNRSTHAGKFTLIQGKQLRPKSTT